MRTTTSALRADLPSLAAEAYLNTGGCGPLARAAAEALAEWAVDAMARGRGSLAGFGRTEAASVALRDDLGRLVGDPDGARIALTGNTTDGLNRVAWGVGLRPGDEVVAQRNRRRLRATEPGQAAAPAGHRVRGPPRQGVGGRPRERAAPTGVEVGL